MFSADLSAELLDPLPVGSVRDAQETRGLASPNCPSAGACRCRRYENKTPMAIRYRRDQTGSPQSGFMPERGGPLFFYAKYRQKGGTVRK